MEHQRKTSTSANQVQNSNTGEQYTIRLSSYTKTKYMIYLLKYNSASTMNCMYSSKYLRRMFTYWFVLVTLLCSFERADCAEGGVVSRSHGGDRFTNPFYANGVKDCANISASCVEGLLLKCSECVCNSRTETYRADIKKCVSTEMLNNFTGCRYKGMKDDDLNLMDKNLPTLDFTKSGSKNIRGLFHIPRGVPINAITCKIENNTSSLNSQGEWVALPNISDILTIRVNDGHGTIARYLTLKWEGVNDFYSGLLIKLHISCHTNADHESGCFAFKSKGRHKSLDISSLITSTLATTTKIYPTEDVFRGSSKVTEPAELPTVGSTTEVTTTEKNVVNKNYTYSVSMPVIIGVSAGVGLVILIIIILAVCFVRHRTRKHEEAKPSIVNTEALPKVHFTAQARFSLIQEAAPVDSADEDYTSLNENRESYDPYYSLRKDDVDLNVIDTILKDAISMESMSPSSEPRYSCHLTKDDAIVIESAKPYSPRQPKYHVLDAPEDDIEPDYEEVDDDEYVMTPSRLLATKPPLPDREYHELEAPSVRLQSEC